MNTQIRKFYDIDYFEISSQNKPISETEMKIFRAAGYNAEKVELIKELIEEEAIRFFKWGTEFETSISETDDGTTIIENIGSGEGFSLSLNSFYKKFYQQSKTK